MCKIVKKNNKEKKSSFYDKLICRQWRNVADFGPSFQSRYRISKKLLKKYADKESHIHEVGCGSGDFLLKLKNDGYKNLSGSDFSKKSTEVVRKDIGCNIEHRDLSKAGAFLNKKEDVVVCLEVLEHIEDDKTAIVNIYNMLSEKGLLIISAPLSMEYWSLQDDFSGHVRRYEIGDLEKKLRQTGFCIMESFGWGSFIYPFYHRILSKINPATIRANTQKFAKIIKAVIAYLLSCLFYIEELTKTKKRARRIFVVAKKK